MLQRWGQETSRCALKQQQLLAAAQHHEQRSRRRVLAAWGEAAAWRARSRRSGQLAVQHHNTSLMLMALAALEGHVRWVGG